MKSELKDVVRHSPFKGLMHGVSSADLILKLRPADKGR